MAIFNNDGVHDDMIDRVMILFFISISNHKFSLILERKQQAIPRSEESQSLEIHIKGIVHSLLCICWSWNTVRIVLHSCAHLETQA